MKAGTVAAGISMIAPVCGFFAFLAARFLVSKEPKPTKATLSPALRASVTLSTNAFNALSESYLVN